LALAVRFAPDLRARPAPADPPKPPVAATPAPKPADTEPRTMRTMTGYTTTVYVAYGKSGTLATYSEKQVRLWDAGGRTLHLLGHLGFISTVCFSPDGKTLATSDASTVRFWDVNTGNPLDARAGPLAGVVRLAYSPDGKRLACAFDSGEIR